jgi:hypothetical protein
MSTMVNVIVRTALTGNGPVGRNMSRDPENGYFSRGLWEEIINALTKLSSVPGQRHRADTGVPLPQ